ncbi:hypothetical protein CCM_09370 [Cordyceps militaris CM01]|uniref:Uncharacterized protein n=1 Tax=Cordyceps militaris (strain CM01) TaxID=983644 RepID=G3JUL2_CORMM|nr:uncharacterized protein CCM_09370 [Cordyceps militaris CM01]EGX87748.1 hypothetical protein CCM_09370 [Cordyceps militaris CM01]
MQVPGEAPGRDKRGGCRPNANDASGWPNGWAKGQFFDLLGFSVVGEVECQVFSVSRLSSLISCLVFRLPSLDILRALPWPGRLSQLLLCRDYDNASHWGTKARSLSATRTAGSAPSLASSLDMSTPDLPNPRNTPSCPHCRTSRKKENRLAKRRDPLVPGPGGSAFCRRIQKRGRRSSADKKRRLSTRIIVTGIFCSATRSRMMMESNQKDERAEQERKETEGDRIGRPSTFKLQKRTAVVVVLSLSRTQSQWRLMVAFMAAGGWRHPLPPFHQTTSSEYHLGPVHRLLYRRRREKKNTTIISSRIHSAAFIQSPLFQRTMTIHLSLLGSLVPPKSFLALLFSQLLSSRTTGAPLSRRSDSASPNMQVRWLSLLVPSQFAALPCPLFTQPSPAMPSLRLTRLVPSSRLDFDFLQPEFGVIQKPPHCAVRVLSLSLAGHPGCDPAPVAILGNHTGRRRCLVRPSYPALPPADSLIFTFLLRAHFHPVSSTRGAHQSSKDAVIPSVFIQSLSRHSFFLGRLPAVILPCSLHSLRSPQPAFTRYHPS